VKSVPEELAMIWLIGGTSESKQLAIALQERGIPFVITVVTASARQLYLPNMLVRVGKLDSGAIAKFIQTERIAAILDASHPFAVEISREAIAIAQALQIPYLRFERERAQPDGKGDETKNHLTSSIKIVNSIEDAIQPDLLEQQRVFLTLGYQQLHLFRHWHDRSQLYARILPATESLQSALNAGFSPDRLIALRPPISAALEKALWQQWQITTVITKASGLPGGEDRKIAIAAELGMQLILVARPKLDYPRQTDSMLESVLFCKESCIVVRR
jgi:precorrin-6A/cobalt-precorrin-6A reductase